MSRTGIVQSLTKLPSTVKYFKKENFMEEENKQSVHFSSKSQTWNTPKEIFLPLNDIWNFTLDVACLEESALCDKYYTPETNGLESSWNDEICWMNPPYNDIRSWSKKAVQEFENGATVVILIPARTDTQAFQTYLAPVATATCFIKGRLKFDNPSLPSWTEDGSHKKTGAPFPSMLVVLDKNMTSEKIEHLKSLGITMVLV